MYDYHFRLIGNFINLVTGSVLKVTDVTSGHNGKDISFAFQEDNFFRRF